MLNGVDRLAAAADEQADIVPAQRALQHPVLLLHLDLRVQPQSVDDLLEQLLERRRRLQLLTRRRSSGS